MLQCPLCNLALRAEEQNDVEIDICDQCHGVWLDHGELQILSNGQDFTPHASASKDLDYLRCPRCDAQRFVTLHVEEGPVAQCEGCYGLFVRGETLERVAAAQTPLLSSAKGDPPRRSFGATAATTADTFLWVDVIVSGLFGWI